VLPAHNEMTSCIVDSSSSVTAAAAAAAGRQDEVDLRQMRPPWRHCVT